MNRDHKDEWIEKRMREIERKVQEEEDYCEKKGMIYHGSAECASEEAEEEYYRIFGYDQEEE